jgi:hypothetical protein
LGGGLEEAGQDIEWTEPDAITGKELNGHGINSPKCDMEDLVLSCRFGQKWRP